MALTKKSREVWPEVSGILLSDTPNLDATEHVGLLTIIAGVRPVALFLDVADAEVKTLTGLLRQIDLISFVGKAPEPASTRESPHRPEITSIFTGGLESSAF